MIIVNRVEEQREVNLDYQAFVDYEVYKNGQVFKWGNSVIKFDCTGKPLIDKVSSSVRETTAKELKCAESDVRIRFLTII